MNKPVVVGIIMGSDSDLDVMSQAAQVLDEFSVPYEMRIISAHRTPDVMSEYANSARDRGLKIIIAGAGGSAHLPGMTASETDLPVIAIPIKRDHHDHEALWSNVKMPNGIPLATMPENGAANGALLAIRILALNDATLATKVSRYWTELHDKVIATDEQLQKNGWKKTLGG